MIYLSLLFTSGKRFTEKDRLCTPYIHYIGYQHFYNYISTVYKHNAVITTVF